MLIIAEIGWNFVGDMELAKEMIRQAADAGADYAKFQTWSVKNLKPGPWDNDGRREIYEKAELSEEKHLILSDCCKANNIKFLTSCFSLDSIDLISRLTNEVKIASTELWNIDLLKEIAKKFDTIFLSTGTCTTQEISLAVDILKEKKVYLLHCVTSYPCPPEKINLPRIKSLGYFTSNIGYSGHGEGIYDALASMKYDVKVIEKHFTIDKNLPGRDNKFAILPHELKFLVDYAKVYKKMDTYNTTEYQECEQEAREVYRGRWSGNQHCNPNKE